MSAINQTITTTFRARGNQAIAQMGAISQGFGSVGRAINENTKLSERLNAQWRAMGTTIRYALAGSAIFGLTRMIGQLRDLQVQAGLISAIGETQSGRPLVGNELSGLMQESRKGAVESITPLNQYNDAVINLLSTIQGVPKNQITPMVTEISKAAQLAQVSAEDATKAFTTMNVAFGEAPNLGNIHKIAQEFFILTREAPGGIAAGQQVITQLGQLAQVTRAAHGTPEDLFSLLLTTLRSGIPPSQAGRGLQYLIQTVAFPAQGTKESEQALASVGITPTTQMPLQQRLSRIFGKARRLGIQGDLGQITRMDEETLSDFETSGGGLKDLGITGAGAQFLGQTFHRIHALRTALAIQGQINTGQAGADLKTITDSANGYVSDINDISKAWDRFEKRAKLKKASIAINAMAVQVASAFEPVLNFAADQFMRVSEIAGRHKTTTKGVAIGGAGVVAALAAARLFAPRKWTSWLNPGQSLVTANAARAALTGGAGLGATPQNPLYVTVVGQLFNAGVGGGSGTPFGGRGGGPLGDAERVGTDILAWKAAKGVGRAGKWFHRFGRKALGLAPLAAAAGENPGLLARMGLVGARVALGPEAWIAQAVMDLGGGGGGQNIRNLRRAQEFFPQGRKITGVEDNMAVGQKNGRAEVWMTIDIQQPGGKVTRKRVHVPVDMWANGRHPSKGGKPRGSRKP